MRVSERWKYLFRAIDKYGQLMDFMLSDRRNTKAAYRCLRKTLKTVSNYRPSSTATDKLAPHPKAIRRLQSEGLLSKDGAHRTSRYLNDIEAYHSPLNRVIRPTRRFQVESDHRNACPLTGRAQCWSTTLTGDKGQWLCLRVWDAAFRS